MIPCRYCTFKAKDYGELARHIKQSKKGHRWGKKWAASYLTKVRILNQKRDLPQRIPMSPDQKEAYNEAKEETHRELSGKTRSETTVCPKCKRPHNEIIPVEYSESPRAWRSPAGMLVILCFQCRPKDTTALNAVP